jgi:predicted metal-dependent hydrolase
MPVLAVNGAEIRYEIKRSPRAKRMRIRVRPGSVDVVAPRFTLGKTIEAFVEAKREWIFKKTAALQERALAITPESFVSGAEVLFRNHHVPLQVERSAAAKPDLRFDNAFLVQIPEALDDTRAERATRELVMSWLAERALEDARGWASEYGDRLGAHPTRIRIGNQKTLWGSCSARGTVSLNWRLVAAPETVFEYVVVHELCHLVEHNHGKRFWGLVEELLPDYRERRAWLKRHGVALG